jgi:uncharacterized membrane protein
MQIGVVILSFLILDVIMTGVTGALPAYLLAFGPTVHPIQTIRDEDRNLEGEIKYWEDRVKDAQQMKDTDAEKRERDLLASAQKSAQKDKVRNAVVRKIMWRVMWLATFFTSIWLWLSRNSA